MGKKNKPIDAVYSEIDTKKKNLYNKYVIEKQDHKIKSKWILRVELLFMDYDVFGVKKIFKEFKNAYIPFKKRVMKEKEVTYKDCESVQNQLNLIIEISKNVETSLINAQGFTNEKKKLKLLTKLLTKRDDLISFKHYIQDYMDKLDKMMEMKTKPKIDINKKQEKNIFQRANVRRGNENDDELK